MKQSLQLSFVLFAASVGCCCRKWGKSPGEFGDLLYRSVIGRQKMAEFRALRSGFERMLASMAFMPLVGLEPNEEVARIITVVVLLIQAVLAIASTRIVGMLNVCAVGVEVAIIGVLVVALTIAVLITGLGSTANLTARGITANAPGYFAVGGGLTIAMIMGLATLVGFDAAAAPSRTMTSALSISTSSTCPSCRPPMVSGASAISMSPSTAARAQSISLSRTTKPKPVPSLSCAKRPLPCPFA